MSMTKEQAVERSTKMRDLVLFCKFIYRLRRTPRRWRVDSWGQTLRLQTARELAYAHCPLTAVYAPHRRQANAYYVGVRAGFSDRTTVLIKDAADYAEFEHTPSPRLCSIVRRILLWATQAKRA